ncbi:MAG: hypothetical protein HDT30_13660 [Clostridiales bacterium]|nr:hypothetical protein [Clostridiales bacterium]
MNGEDFSKESQYEYLYSALAQNYPDIMNTEGKAEAVFQYASMPLQADWKNGEDASAFTFADTVPQKIGGFYVPGAGSVSTAYQDLLRTIKPKIEDENPEYVRLRQKYDDIMDNITNELKEIDDAYTLWKSSVLHQDEAGHPLMTEDEWLSSPTGGQQYQMKLKSLQDDAAETDKEYKNILHAMDAALLRALEDCEKYTMTIVQGGNAIKVPITTISGDLAKDKLRWDGYGKDVYDFETEINKDAEVKTKWKTTYDVKVKHTCHSTNVEQKMSVKRIIADEHYNLKVKFKGVAAYRISRGKWFDDSFVKPDIKLVEGAALNSESFFGENGSLHLIPLTVLVVYKPEFQLTVSKEIYENEFTDEAFLDIDYIELFGVKFGIQGRASLLPKPVENECYMLTFSSPLDSMPQILGVTSSVKLLPKK